MQPFIKHMLNDYAKLYLNSLREFILLNLEVDAAIALVLKTRKMRQRK